LGVTKVAASVILQPLKPMNGLLDVVVKEKKNETALVIGVHKEELSFGKQVTRLMAESGIHIVTIDNGLSHDRSYYRSGFYHSTAHREMYLQLHQQLVGKKVVLVIDLHTGINETGRCADILSADTTLLERMDVLLKGVGKHIFSAPGEERLYEIILPDAKSRNENDSISACHTIIPQKVWNAHEYTYVGLEIYFREAGQGFSSDWEYAAGLIQMLNGSLTN
jgi:hypothetical protein